MSDRTQAAPILPHWPDATVVILVTGGGDPHAIPVSAAVRAGNRQVLLGLAGSRESLRRLRQDPRVALVILAEGDVAVTAYGIAHVSDEHLAGAEGVAGVTVDVDRLQDHGRPTFVIESGVGWRWTDAEAQERDDQVRRALLDLG